MERGRVWGILSGIVVAIAVMGYSIGGIAFHIWTCKLIFDHYGTFWAICGFCMPAIAEVSVAVASFSWGLWFYIFGLGLWLVCSSAGSIAEKPQRLLLVLWLILFGGCSIAFGGGLWNHLTTTTLRPEVAQQMQEYAASTLLLLDGASRDDPVEQVRAAKAKPEIVKAVRELRQAEKDELVRLVNLGLRVRFSVEADVVDYMAPRQNQQGTQRFAFSDRTVRIINSVPPKMRTAMDIADIAALANETNRQFGQLKSDRPDRAQINAGIEARRRIVGQTYQDLFGLPMPPHLDVNSEDGEGSNSR